MFHEIRISFILSSLFSCFDLFFHALITHVVYTLEVTTHFSYVSNTKFLTNAVRNKLLENKYTKTGKVIDMSLLLPCNFVSVLYIEQANYVTKV